MWGNSSTTLSSFLRLGLKLSSRFPFYIQSKLLAIGSYIGDIVRFPPTKLLPRQFKSQSNEIFDLQFFSSIEPALATDQWVKIFLNLVKNSQSYSNFKSKKLTPRDIIPRRVNKKPPKHDSLGYDSLGYDTPVGQSPR